MRDTTTHIEEKVREMMRKKTPKERLEMGCSMNATSKQLIIRSILENNFDISKTALRQEFFLKFYGNDYSQSERDKILKHLENCSSCFPNSQHTT